MDTARAPEGDAPYIQLRQIGDRVECAGPTTCLFGTKIESTDHAPPDGVFAEWTWDDHRLLARNDRYGCYPLYYVTGPGAIALSPSIPTLLNLGASRDFDDAAFAVFLRLGHCLGDDTLFAHIRALPPNAELTWHDGQLQIRGGSVQPQSSQMTRAAAMDGLTMLLRQAVRRRVPPSDDFAVSLSGGEDSRHIVFALCEIGRRPRCIIYESWWGQLRHDESVAAAVARELRLEHVVLRGHGSPLRAELRKNLLTGFGSYRHPQVLLLRDRLPAGITTIFDGLAGDLARCESLNPGNVSLMQAGRFEALARNILDTIGDRMTSVLSEPLRRRFTADAAIARLTAELARHADAPNPIGSYVFWNLIRREIALAPLLLASVVRHTHVPYLDHDLYDHVASLPAAMLMDHRLHYDAIARAYPQYAAIPFATGAMAWSHRWHVRRFALELLPYLSRAPSQFVRRPLVAMHLAQTIVSGWPGTLARLGPHPEKLARLTHLLQLERLLAE